MPSIPEVVQFFRGQLLQTPRLPTKNLLNKTMIVTGANTGLGFECAKHLLVNLNLSNLILACRDVRKGEAAKDAILKDSNLSDRASIEVWQVDLENYKSVLSFSNRVRTQLPRLDGFVANAGVSMKDFTISEDCERTLTVNVISTFLLALLVLPKLQETAKTCDTSTNLTIVGSIIHFFAPYAQLQIPNQIGIFEALSDPKTADMSGRYNLSKLIVTQCARELAQRLPASTDDKHRQVVVNCVNPGWCKTELFRHEDPGVGARIGLRLIGRSGEVGSRTLVHAVTAGEETHGRFLSECQVKPESQFVRSAEGQKIQIRLWKELLVKIEGISPGAANVCHG